MKKLGKVMRKKSKKSTAKRLLEPTGRWAGEPPPEEACNYGDTGKVKKKRSWTMWAVMTNGDLGGVLYDKRVGALSLIKEWKFQNEMRGYTEHLVAKKVKVTEV